MRLATLAIGFALVGCSSIRPDPTAVTESYQLYLSPTFYNPMDLTVERTSDSAFISAQRYRGLGGYAPKRLGSPSTRKLSEQEWQAFAHAIKRHGFWTGRVKSYKTLDNDGIHTLLIARNSNSAKVVHCYGSLASYDLNLLPIVGAFGELEK